MKHPFIKILVFLLLVGLFYICGGFALPRGAFDSPIFFKHSPVIPWVMIIVCFVYGAVVAVWGNKTVGIIYPVSFRAGYIIFGALLMLMAVVFTSCGRFVDSHRPIKAHAVAAREHSV